MKSFIRISIASAALGALLTLSLHIHVEASSLNPDHHPCAVCQTPTISQDSEPSATAPDIQQFDALAQPNFFIAVKSHHSIEPTRGPPSK